MKRFFRILVLLFAVSISSAFAQKTYKIGDYYNDGTKEGVVFWVDKTGTSGEIISLDEAVLPWTTNDQGIGLATTNHAYDGKVNTDKVMAFEDAHEHQAFVWCRNKGKDWYLPAIGEVACFCVDSSVDVINRSLTARGAKKLSTNSEDYYWSSTVSDASDDELGSMLKFVCALCMPAYIDIYKADQSIRVISKGDECRVRAVARFGNVSMAQFASGFSQTTNTTASSTTTAKTYKVGDYYNDGTKEGVVFWVDATGNHGKIVNIHCAYWMQWCSLTYLKKRIMVGATSKTDGKANTDKALARSDYKEFPVFSYCKSLGDDWYLPAINELELLLLDKNVFNAVNTTLKRYNETLWPEFDDGVILSYWSSTETIEVAACCVHRTEGSTSALKVYSQSQLVRAVAAF